MTDGLTPRVLGLAIALRQLQVDFELDSAAGTRRLPDGHAITMRWSGGLLELERDDGEVAILNPDAMIFRSPP